MAIGAVAAGFMVQVNPAQAARIACSTTIGEKVSPLDINNPSSGCEYDPTINQDSLANINSVGFFGKSDWLFGGKDDDGEKNSDGVVFDFNFEADSKEGTISLLGDSGLPQIVKDKILGLSSPVTDILLTFKGGNSLDVSVVAYLLKINGNPSGEYSWSTPLFGPDARDVSHVSVFYRAPKDGVPIPTPALLPGLIGMGVAALRKRKSEEAQDA